MEYFLNDGYYYSFSDARHFPLYIYLFSYGVFVTFVECIITNSICTFMFLFDWFSGCFFRSLACGCRSQDGYHILIYEVTPSSYQPAALMAV